MGAGNVARTWLQRVRTGFWGNARASEARPYMGSMVVDEGGIRSGNQGGAGPPRRKKHVGTRCTQL